VLLSDWKEGSGTLMSGLKKRKHQVPLMGSAAARALAFTMPASRGLSLDHQVSYIAAGAGAAFFARRALRFAGFFAALRRVFLAAPLAPALRTVRFLAFAFVFVFRFAFFAVIGMCNDSSNVFGLCESHPRNVRNMSRLR
jgi:hypothetical protein